MILRRLADAISGQNWITVVIEVLIVVIGIFVGLQVDDWNQTRKERAAEQRYLERLVVEFAENRDGATSRAEAHEGRARILEALFRYASGSNPEPPAMGEVARALCRWHILPSFRLSTGTYDELVATGNLRLIRSDQLRNLLLEAHSEHDLVRRQTGLFGDTIRELAAPLRAYLDWAPLFDGPRDQDLRSLNTTSADCRVDMEGLRQADGIPSIFAELYRSQAIFADYRRREAEVDARVLARLTELLGGEPDH